MMNYGILWIIMNSVSIFLSGSMTGLRQEISKHVVLNILDTLNENDFVNIFTFSETTQELVPCFNDTLVQVRVALIENSEN